MKRIVFVFTVLLVLCFPCRAQKDATDKALKEQGYTLVKTDSIIGTKLICDHYTCEGKKSLRLITFNVSERGTSYMVIDEDPVGLSRKPTSLVWENDMLYYRLYFKNGPIALKEPGQDGKVQELTVFDDGSIIPRNVYDGIFDWNTFVYREFSRPKMGEANGGSIKTLVLGDLPNEPIKHNDKIETFVLGKGAFLIKDRYYLINITPKRVERRPVGQIINNEFFYINSSDSIINVTKEKEENTEFVIVKYKNGDYAKFSSRGFPNYYTECSIHRNGAVYKYKADPYGKDTPPVLVYPDGSFFEGSLTNEMGDIVYSGRAILIGDEISPYYGTLTKADGTQVEYVSGVNQEEKKMQRREEFQKVYTELCDKYGKKYVDAVLTDRKPVIGMPEELFVLAFKAELASESNSLRLYRVKGFGFTGINNSILSDQVLKWSVWVDNGRVSDIKYWD